MGHAPHAILAYGYDLGHDFANLDDCLEDLATAALSRAQEKDDETKEFSDIVERLTGLTFQRHGDDVSETYILSAVTHHTDWDGPISVPDLVVPDGADDQLNWALGVLGFDDMPAKPGWLLAAQLSG